MNAFEILYQGALLAGIQYDQDEEEAYAEDIQRRGVGTLAPQPDIVWHLPNTGFWREITPGFEQFVEFK